MFDADFARYGNATAATVKAAVNEYLNTRNRLLVRFRPEPSGAPSTLTVDRSKEPPLGTDRPFTAPDVKSAKLDNGVEIFVVERPELPKVSVSVASRSGSVNDPAGKGGLASLTARVMRRGTKAKSALEIDDTLGDLGTSMAWVAGRENARLSLEVLKRNLSPARRFSPTSCCSRRFRRPNSIARRSWRSMAWGSRRTIRRQSPIGCRSCSPSAWIIRTAGRPAVCPERSGPSPATISIRFHQAQWKPGSSALVFVGDVTLAEATALAKQHFGSWSGGAAPTVTIPPPQPVGPAKVYLIDRQNAAQTIIAHVLPAPPRASPSTQR